MSRICNNTAVVLVIALFALTCCTRREQGATPKNTLATAEETVMAYCELDANGARLTSTTWSKVLPYIAWQEEAGWDRVVVISGVSVAKSGTQSEQKALVTVEYRVLGILSQDYLTSRKTESVRFVLRKTDAGWKITDPDFLPPHVYVNAIIRHLEETKSIETARKIADSEK
jgi:hypothetical protein